MNGLNLHAMVRGSINRVLPDTILKLYRSNGQTLSEGFATPTYSEPITIKASFQSEGDATLNFANMAGQNTYTRKVYLYADDNRRDRPWGLLRPLARSGDYLEDANGDFWYVTSIIEDFSAVGWVSLRAVMQQEKPTLEISGATP